MELHAEAAITALERVLLLWDGPMYTGQGTPVADIAFLARVCLRQRSQRLVRLGGSPDSWLVIAEVASLRRHILKSMARVEEAMCATMGIAAELGGVHELDVALASRDAYLAYLRSIRSIGARLSAGALELVSALRLCATNIAKLIGRDIYEHLRVDDRRQLRELQQRIFAAVQQPEDELSARRLWMDIQSSTELLMQIHGRGALIEHDFELLARALGSGDEPLALSADRRRSLDALEGRDPHVDELLADPHALESSLRAALIALHDHLAHNLGRAPLGPAAVSVEAIAW